MPTTVISYRAPASYRRCGNNLYDTRGSKYVAVRRTSHNNGSSAKYVAVRNYAPRTKYVAVRNYAPRTRYVAVRNVDFDNDDLRYVKVRRDAYRPEAGTKYIAVRSGYRKGNGIVGYIDDAPRYVAIRQPAPQTRYVAVRNIEIDDEPGYVAVRSAAPRTRYVAVRDVDFNDDQPGYVAVRNAGNGCMRAVAVQNCLDDVETVSANPAMINEIAVRDVSFDDDEIVLPAESVGRTNYVEYAPAAYYNGSDDAYIAASDVEDPTLHRMAVHNDPDVVTTRTITFPASYSNDDYINELAYLDGGGATYVANDDIEDACLRRVSMPEISYVPVEDIEDRPTYIVNENTAPSVRYVSLVDEDEDFIDNDATYSVVNEVDDTCLRAVAPRTCDNDLDRATVSVIPIDNVDEMEAENISYVPVNDVNYVETTDIASDECPMMVSSVAGAPTFVEEGDDVLIADLSGTRQIASRYGYRDGFEDGQEAALERDVYHPENSGDYQKATEGYEDTFGDKDVYKDVYRGSYLDGYRAGFDSVGSTG